MLAVFEPDEAVQLPVVLRMLTPKADAFLTIKKFLAYEYYFYGFPFFGSSALVVLPFKLGGAIDNTPLVMLSLRQLISVLPMLIALLLLTYMQDGFSSWRSVALFLFLVLVPAVLKNGFWWHPDGLVLLLAVLVIFFLWRDENRFGLSFYLASVAAGILTATKLVGVFFFLAVLVSLIWGYKSRRLTLAGVVRHGVFFILVMVLSFVIANPFLLSEWARPDYFSKLLGQNAVLSQGYGIQYATGLKAFIEQFQLSYGLVITLFLAVAGNVNGLFNPKTRRLHLLILAWTLPISVYLISSVHFKFQYWLPVILPLYSGLCTLLPETTPQGGKFNLNRWMQIIISVFLLAQFVFFGISAVKAFETRARRAEANPLILAFDRIQQRLDLINKDELMIYHDVRLYMPPHSGWQYEATTDLLSYDWIRARNFDVLVLMQQRLDDYLHSGAVGVDPDGFAKSQLFYKDANVGLLEDYYLLDRDTTALIFVTEQICESQPGLCP